MSPSGCCRAIGACWSGTAACRGWRRRCWGCATAQTGPCGGPGFTSPPPARGPTPTSLAEPPGPCGGPGFTSPPPARGPTPTSLAEPPGPCGCSAWCSFWRWPA
ncbi:hypothetical protein C5U48_19360 [Mycolicibacter virginiensis]|uniref:Uncharacterized protein n=1 Tax=Mycolicibacter virginiensis TaxID=1795032 RepID=A0A9X7NX60_9MYCO|nr:hypothetical protein C5U48_19360 [Mycolicibacter virginiensis]